MDELLKMKTCDFMDEAERQLIEASADSRRESNLLDSLKHDQNGQDGQRMLDDDEFEEELNGGAGAMVQM